MIQKPEAVQQQISPTLGTHIRVTFKIWLDTRSIIKLRPARAVQILNSKIEVGSSKVVTIEGKV
jgi:hypothetical protein